MTDYQIPASAIEAAAEEIWADPKGNEMADFRRAVKRLFDELGMEVERIIRVEDSTGASHYYDSRWMPVEEQVVETAMTDPGPTQTKDEALEP